MIVKVVSSLGLITCVTPETFNVERLMCKAWSFLLDKAKMCDTVTPVHSTLTVTHYTLHTSSLTSR